MHIIFYLLDLPALGWELRALLTVAIQQTWVPATPLLTAPPIVRPIIDAQYMLEDLDKTEYCQSVSMLQRYTLVFLSV